MKTFKKIVKIFVIVIGVIVLAVVLFTVGINAFVRFSTKNRIIDADEAADLTDVDCIIVLGASVKHGDTPSLMLSDRLDRAIELYKAGVAPKIIMSGDHGSKYYNEVQVMKDYAIARGVPSEDIFMDHAGFSTYDTMYRAKEIFGAKKVSLGVFENNEPAYRCYKAVGFNDVILDKTEKYQVLGEEWNCVELEILL